jgi:AraC family transcriptional regulator of adaptative response / DNA-3-methyladenine glycosylase II
MEQAVRARDPRFDGLFFVGISTTRIYCRPICPSRLSRSEHRLFFPSAGAAEAAGFRPCLRCRPELAPGRAPVDAVSRLARLAADRIANGGLNGCGVAELARDLGVGERHLRRVLEREVGASPLELAQTHRLLLAKRLLIDTNLSITRIAYASGFQSLRRFNAVFRDRYRLNPRALRGINRSAEPAVPGTMTEAMVPLTLSYRPPFSWDGHLAWFRRHPLTRAEVVEASRYTRSVELNGRFGVVTVEMVESPAGPGPETRYLRLGLSESLVPVLMPLLRGLKRLFDLDAESAVIDAHLARNGLRLLVTACPGLRVPGAITGFEALLRETVARFGGPGTAGRLVGLLGAPAPENVWGVDRMLPTAERVAGTGESELLSLGLGERGARILVGAARQIVAGRLRLDGSEELPAALDRLKEVPGVDDRFATVILMRVMRWADAFPLAALPLQDATGARRATGLPARAEGWRPWRAYAAQHLWLADWNHRTSEPEHDPRWSPPASLAV